MSVSGWAFFAQIETGVLGGGVWDCGCLWAFQCAAGAVVVWEWAAATCAGGQRANLGEKGDLARKVDVWATFAQT